MKHLRISASLVLTAFLAACGGGSGGSSALPSAGGGSTSHQMAMATFTFKIPGKKAMTQLRRPLYSSQATQGVAIDWQSTDPTHPDLAYAISATCPMTLPQGITACSIDANGGTDYTFTFPISPGSYAFTVSTFDAAPTGTLPTAGTFSSPAAMLAQGQLPAPLVVSSGQALTTVPSMTFYGVPASVSFVPATSQSHVTQLGTASYGIIGNEPQKFFVEALDADGFVIASSDSGAPAMMVCESTSDPQQFFKISSTADPNEFTLQAMAAPSDTKGATIEAEATAGGTGLPPVTTNYQMLPIQELWNIAASGVSKPGLLGYALMPPAYKPTNPIDDVFDDPSLNLCGTSTACSFQSATGNIDGSIIAGASYTVGGRLYNIAPATGPLALPTSPLAYTGEPGLSLYQANLVTDAAGHLYILDGEIGFLAELNAATDSVSNARITSGFSTPTGITIAPSLAAIPSALQQTVWVGDSSGTPIRAYSLNASTLTPITVTLAGSPLPAVASGLAFDSNGNLWVYDGSGIFVFSVSSGTGGITLTQLLASAHTPTYGALAGNTLTPTAQGVVYYSSAAYGLVAMTLSGCPTACAVTDSLALSAGGNGPSSFITP